MRTRLEEELIAREFLDVSSSTDYTSVSRRNSWAAALADANRRGNDPVRRWRPLKKRSTAAVFRFIQTASGSRNARRRKACQPPGLAPDG